MTDHVLARQGEFPDVELLVRLYLRDFIRLAGQALTVTDEPRNPLEPPVVTVLQVPGPAPARTRRWESNLRIETGAFGVTRADSRDINAQIETLMLDLPRANYQGVLIDSPIGKNTTPGQVPYSPEVRRIPMTWDIVVRKHQNTDVVVTV